MQYSIIPFFFLAPSSLSNLSNSCFSVPLAGFSFGLRLELYPQASVHSSSLSRCEFFSSHGFNGYLSLNDLQSPAPSLTSKGLSNYISNCRVNLDLHSSPSFQVSYLDSWLLLLLISFISKTSQATCSPLYFICLFIPQISAYCSASLSYAAFAGYSYYYNDVYFFG